MTVGFVPGKPLDASAVPGVYVFGYVRVSTIEQADGYGPEIQRNAIIRLSEANKWPTPDIREEAKSGKSMAERAVFESIRRDAMQKNDAGVEVHIVFYRMDRMARNMTEGELFIVSMQKAGILLHSCDPTEQSALMDCTDDPFRLAFRQIIGVFAQLEHGTIRKRLLSGRKAKSKSGGYSGGRLPFGYDSRDIVVQGKSVGTEIFVDDDKAKAIEEVFELRAKQYSLEDIVGLMDDTRPGMLSWSVQSIRRILANEELYRSGQYKDRMGGVVVKEDLKILK